MKFRDFFPISDIQSSPVGDERSSVQFERADMQMIRWMCGISMKDRKTNEECGPTEGACSMAFPAMSTRPRTSAL